MPSAGRYQVTVTDLGFPAKFGSFAVIVTRGTVAVANVIGGGFLNFDVNIGVEPEQLADIASELRQMLHLRDKPVLSPAPLIDG